LKIDLSTISTLSFLLLTFRASNQKQWHTINLKIIWVWFQATDEMVRYTVDGTTSTIDAVISNILSLHSLYFHFHFHFHFHNHLTLVPFQFFNCLSFLFSLLFFFLGLSVYLGSCLSMGLCITISFHCFVFLFLFFLHFDFILLKAFQWKVEKKYEITEVFN